MSYFSCTLAAVTAVMWISSPALSQSAAVGDTCEPTVADTSRFGTAVVYRECAVTKPAEIKRSNAPNFAAPNGTRCLSVELEFVVNANGNVLPQSARVLRADNEEYGELVLKSLGRWRFEPAQLSGKQVAQLVTTVKSRSFTDALGRTSYTIGDNPPPPIRGGRAGTIPIKPERGVTGCEPR